ncbi:MAG: HXXEE domain-containing protein [Parvibaculum sp.]|nr:HXXEE domain-containing protein [Parvibaculum sp.]
MRVLFRYPQLCWWLIPIVCLHNFEEWLTFPIFTEERLLLAGILGVDDTLNSWRVIQIALVIVTLLPAALVIYASIGARRPFKDWLVCWSAATYLANVFLPHIPASIAVGGYTPGLVTAAFVNLPFCSLLLYRAVREGYVQRWQAIGALSVGFLCLPLILPMIYAVSRTFATIL